MLLIRTDYRPATDLGFLLHKHPGRMHVAEMPFGTARLLFTEASDEACAVAVIVEIDPIGLVRGSGMNGQDQYVNDRPYVASMRQNRWMSITKVLKNTLRREFLDNMKSDC